MAETHTLNTKVNTLNGVDKYQPTCVEVLICTYKQTGDESFGFQDILTQFYVIEFYNEIKCSTDLGRLVDRIESAVFICFYTLY